MYIQIALHRGGVVAMRALEGLHTAMQAGVVLSEIVSQAKPHSTFTTLEGPLTCVYNLMIL